MVEHEVQQEFYKCKLPQKLSKGDGLARQCPSPAEEGRKALRQRLLEKGVDLKEIAGVGSK